MTREETPLQAAKRLGLPYVRLVIDRRHLKNGKGRVSVEGPVSMNCAGMAESLLRAVLGDPD